MLDITCIQRLLPYSYLRLYWWFNTGIQRTSNHFTLELLINYITYLIEELMAKKGAKVERSQVNSSQPYEVKYLAGKLGVSSQAITGAKRATGSSDRKEIEQYIKNKNKG